MRSRSWGTTGSGKRLPAGWGNGVNPAGNSPHRGSSPAPLPAADCDAVTGFGIGEILKPTLPGADLAPPGNCGGAFFGDGKGQAAADLAFIAKLPEVSGAARTTWATFNGSRSSACTTLDGPAKCATLGAYASLTLPSSPAVSVELPTGRGLLFGGILVGTNWATQGGAEAADNAGPTFCGGGCIVTAEGVGVAYGGGPPGGGGCTVTTERVGYVFGGGPPTTSSDTVDVVPASDGGDDGCCFVTGSGCPKVTPPLAVQATCWWLTKFQLGSLSPMTIESTPLDAVWSTSASRGVNATE